MLDAIRDTILSELQTRTDAKIIKYGDRGQSSIEIVANPEKIIIIDFNPDEVEVYNSVCSWEGFDYQRNDAASTLVLSDPDFIPKLFNVLRDRYQGPVNSVVPY